MFSEPYDSVLSKWCTNLHVECCHLQTRETGIVLYKKQVQISTWQDSMDVVTLRTSGMSENKAAS